MNREAITVLRNVLAVLPRERFTMAHYTTVGTGKDDRLSSEQLKHDCGTAACMVGWTNALLSPLYTSNAGDVAGARVLLDLSYDQANKLFHPWEDRSPRPIPWIDITNEQAVKVLDHLLETGEVDWDACLR